MSECHKTRYLTPADAAISALHRGWTNFRIYRCPHCKGAAHLSQGRTTRKHRMVTASVGG